MAGVGGDEKMKAVFALYAGYLIHATGLMETGDLAGLLGVRLHTMIDIRGLTYRVLGKTSEEYISEGPLEQRVRICRYIAKRLRSKAVIDFAILSDIDVFVDGEIKQWKFYDGPYVGDSDDEENDDDDRKPPPPPKTTSVAIKPTSFSQFKDELKSDKPKIVYNKDGSVRKPMGGYRIRRNQPVATSTSAAAPKVVYNKDGSVRKPMGGNRRRPNQQASTTTTTATPSRAPNRLQQLKNERRNFSKGSNAPKPQQDAGSDGSGSSKSKRRRLVLSDSEEEEDEDFKKKKKVVAYRSVVTRREEEEKEDEESVDFIDSDASSHGYERGDRKKAVVVETNDSDYGDSESSDGDYAPPPRKNRRRYAEKFYFDEEEDDEASVKSDECEEVEFIDEKKEAQEIKHDFVQTYRTVPIREEPKETDLYCFQCRTYMNRDSFSVAQQKVQDDGRRFCLAHTSTSSFNQDYQKNT